MFSLLIGLGHASPVLVAVDDTQWLDGPSRQVAAYAAASVAEARSGCSRPSGRSRHPDPELRTATLDTTQATSVCVGPLSIGALHHVVRHEHGRSLPRPAMVRIAELSGGNPFSRPSSARSLDGRRPGSSWTSITADQYVRDRLTALDPSGRDALLVASAVASPTPALIGRATEMSDATEVVASMEDTGLIELVGGRVRFTHPLWANAVYREASSSRRVVLHRRLSVLVEDVEERARHLALATVEFDAGHRPSAGRGGRPRPTSRRRLGGSRAGGARFTLGATEPERRLRAALAITSAATTRHAPANS